MTDFELFIKENKLQKKDVADYLGVSKAFITQISSGQRSLPKDKIALLKANEDWDTSMFADEEIKRITATSTGGGNASVNIGSHNKVSASSELWEVKVQALNDKIELLKQQLEDKDRQIEFLKTLISK